MINKNMLPNSRVIDLEQPRFTGMPIHPSHMPGYFYALHRRHSDVNGTARTSASGVLTMMEHTGTHIDALSHQAAHGCLHGGIVAESVEGPAGFSAGGVEEIPPIVTRAVFVDLAGEGRLPERYEFTADDLEAKLKTRPQKGDVLIVRTGYDQLWNEPEAYLRSAGAHKSASIWAADHGVLAVGADNMAWDVPGIVDAESGVTLFAHFYLLPQKGIYIIENLKLDELSQAQIDTVMFVCLPLKLKGATGSPVRPVAILA
jgi:kynurenine formamidase